MKKVLLIALSGFMPFLLNSQCSATVNSTPVTCYNACNGTATAVANGNSPYTYLWGPGGQTTLTVSGLCAGPYSVNVIDANGCSTTQYFTITQPTQVVAGYSTVPATCSNCPNGSATANPTGGTPPYTYSWFPSGSTGVTETGMDPGTYSFTITDASGCTVGTLFNIGNSVGIYDQNAGGNFSVYPNPATETVNISQTFSNPVVAQISLTNLLGETVYTETKINVRDLYTTLNLSELPYGIYFVSVSTISGISTQKIVRQ